MDKKTKESYDQNAQQTYEFHKDLRPTRLYDLALSFFIKDKPTLDLGCGIGRDAEWLNKTGFPTEGCDFSKQLLIIASKNFPNIHFFEDSLPLLQTIQDNKYQNLFSSAVLQHIPKESLTEAISNIVRVMISRGIGIISFRGTKEINQREDGKLYENYQIEQISEILQSFKCKILLEESLKDDYRNLTWFTLVFEKA